MFLDYIQNSLPDKLGTIYFYLWVTIGLPTFAFLPMFDVFNFNIYSFTWRAIAGVIVMVLLWVGVKGLKQIKQTKNPAINKEVITLSK